MFGGDGFCDSIRSVISERTFVGGGGGAGDGAGAGAGAGAGPCAGVPAFPPSSSPLAARGDRLPEIHFDQKAMYAFLSYAKTQSHSRKVV
ncbi:hypothetical protein GCM10027021_24890 [Dyella kyungheensis]